MHCTAVSKITENGVRHCCAGSQKKNKNISHFFLSNHKKCYLVLARLTNKKMWVNYSYIKVTSRKFFRCVSSKHLLIIFGKLFHLVVPLNTFNWFSHLSICPNCFFSCTLMIESNDDLEFNSISTKVIRSSKSSWIFFSNQIFCFCFLLTQF